MAYNLFPHDLHLRLMIVAKGRMSDGFCYIGWDMDRHKLVRPVLRINSCRWLPAKDKDLNIGEKHLFKVRSPELEGISHPHRANDILVSYRRPCDQTAKTLDSSDVVNLYDILTEQSHQTVKEAFNNPKQFNGEYVFEHTKCPSVGVYRCKRGKLRITTANDSRGERRCEITQDAPVHVYNYKITAVDDELPDVDSSEDVLVILGLTRPYKGSSHQFTKLRCYVIIVGFVTRSTNTQQQSPLNVLDGENAYVSEALSAQFLGIGKKRKLETNYGIEEKFISRRLKSEFTETSR